MDMQITQENSGIAIAYTVDAIKTVVETEFNRIKRLQSIVSPNTEEPVTEVEENDITNQTTN